MKRFPIKQGYQEDITKILLYDKLFKQKDIYKIMQGSEK